MFKCKSKQCIPFWWKCDGVADCSDSSDEIGCLQTIRPDSGGQIFFRVCTQNTWFHRILPAKVIQITKDSSIIIKDIKIHFIGFIRELIGSFPLDKQRMLIRKSRGEVTYGSSYLEWFSKEARQNYGEVYQIRAVDTGLTEGTRLTEIRQSGPFSNFNSPLHNLWVLKYKFEIVTIVELDHILNF